MFMGQWFKKRQVSRRKGESTRAVRKLVGEQLEPRQLLAFVTAQKFDLSFLGDHVENQDAYQTTPNILHLRVGDIVNPTTGEVARAESWLRIHGSIDTTSDVDWFRVDLTARTGLFLDVDAADSGGTLNADLSVFNATNGTTPMASNGNGLDFQEPPQNNLATLAATNDPSLYLDLQPGTYYVRVRAESGTTGAYKLLAFGDTTYASAYPSLSSRPGAADTLYLDPDGDTGTFNSLNYTAAPYDQNGSTLEITPAERLAVWNLWRTTSEKYSSFDVNVTTVSPAAFGDGQAIHMILTNSSATIVGVSANTNGVSFLNSYTQGGATNNQGFVFWSAIRGGNPPSSSSAEIVRFPITLGSTAAHEFGHPLGLQHINDDFNANTDPIMVTTSTSSLRRTWTNGENVVSENQDDMAEITSTTIAYRVADAGLSFSTPTPITNLETRNGVISQNTNETDFYSFQSTANTSYCLEVDEYFGTLDPTMRLLNASGAQLSTTNRPAGSLDQFVNYTSTGTVIIEVGKSAMYGRVGQYQLRATTWKNAANPYDVNGDGLVTTGDALLGINMMAVKPFTDTSGAIIRCNVGNSLAYYDVNGDNFLTTNDILQVINQLHILSNGEGEAPTNGDWGVITYSDRPNNNITYSDMVYSITASRTGTLSVQGLFNAQAGNIRLELRDRLNFQTILASSQAITGGQRLDYAATAGQEYFLYIAGTNPDLDLKLVNLVYQSGSTVDVAGSSSNDTFTFTAGSTHTVNVNGLPYSFSSGSVSQFAFHGSSGADTATVTGSASAESASLSSTSFTFYGAGYTITGDGIETKRAYSGGGNDYAYLYDTSGNDTLLTQVGYSYMSGAGYASYVHNFYGVYGYASSGYDVSYFYDSAGNDTFYNTSTYSYMSGAGFYHRGNGFDESYGYAVNGGYDQAYFYDSSSSDYFYGRSNYAYMSGGGVFRYGSGFDVVNAYGYYGGVNTWDVQSVNYLFYRYGTWAN